MRSEPPPTEVVINQTGAWKLPGALLERGIRAALESENIRGGELSVTFLDDPGILALNREYFGRDQPTDVIAFALHGPGEAIFGDIYIGFDQARRQAEELSVPLEEELLRLAVHGTLHVLGHHHPEDEGRGESRMYRLQEEIVSTVLGSA